MAEYIDNSGKRWVEKGNNFYSGDGKVKLNRKLMGHYLKTNGGNELHRSSDVNKAFREAAYIRDELSRKKRNGEDIKYKHI